MPVPAQRNSAVQRRFTAAAPDTVWVGDVTMIRTGEGPLYLATVLDLFSRRLLGYATSTHHDAERTTASLQMAATVRGGQVHGVIFHSDRGSEGGFNWSSQHFDRGVCGGDDAGAAAGGAALSRAGAVAGAADGGVAGGSGLVLGGDRPRDQDRGRRGRSRGVIAGCVPVVPSRWRRESLSAGGGVGSVSVVLRA